MLDARLKPWVIKLDPTPSLELSPRGLSHARAASLREQDDLAPMTKKAEAMHQQEHAAVHIDEQHDFTHMMFEDDLDDVVHDVAHLKLQKAKLRAFRRRRFRHSHADHAPSRRALLRASRVLLHAQVATDEQQDEDGGEEQQEKDGRSGETRVVGAARLRIAMLRSLFDLLGIAKPAARLAASALALRTRSVVSKVRGCLSDGSQSVLVGNAVTSKMSPAHVTAISDYEVERLRAQNADHWLPLHPNLASVSLFAYAVGASTQKANICLTTFAGQGPAVAGQSPQVGCAPAMVAAARTAEVFPVSRLNSQAQTPQMTLSKYRA